MLSWRIQVLTGSHDPGVMFSGHPLLGVVESCFGMLAVFAFVAGVASLVRSKT